MGVRLYVFGIPEQFREGHSGKQEQIVIFSNKAKELTHTSLSVFLGSLNQCIASQVTYSEHLDAAEVKVFKRAHFEAFKLLISHQKA